MTEADTEREIDQLKRFYAVDNLRDLALAQAKHVERLQAKLPPTPDTQPRKSRFA